MFQPLFWGFQLGSTTLLGFNKGMVIWGTVQLRETERMRLEVTGVQLPPEDAFSWSPRSKGGRW